MIAWVMLVSVSLCTLITLTVSILRIRLYSTKWYSVWSRLLHVAPPAQATVVRGLPDAAFILDQHHTIVDFNEAAAKLANLSDLPGQPIAHVLAHMPSVVARCKAMTTTHQFETSCNNPDRSFYETTITPLFDRHGQLTGRLLLLRDITVRRLTELRQQVLVEVGALLSAPPHAALPLSDVAQLVAEYLVDTCAIYLIDTDGQMRMFGASSHPCITLPFHGDEALDVARAWLRAMDGSRLIIDEATRSQLLTDTTQAAHYVSQLRSVVCVPLQSHEHTYGTLLLATMKNGRVLGANDAALADTLAQQITIAIENHRLFKALQASESRYRAASAEAEHASIAKSAFLTMMSHEIRTPLMGVLGIADLLGRTNVQNGQNELLNILVRNAHSLRTTITDILDITKIEAGKLELVKEPVDLVQCIEDAVNTVAFQASEKGLDLTYQLDTNVPAVVLTDYVRLRQILMNVLSNAVKFTEHGAITIRVTSDGPSNSQHGAEIIRFTVKDTGIGIAPEHCAQLFDPFYQGNPDSKQRYGGSGIGLTISKHLCELMGGTIDAVSHPGEGSTFLFTLVGDPLPDVQSKMPLCAVPLLQGKRMLLIGMAATEQTMLATHVQTWGMRVHTTTISEAVHILQTGMRHDVIIVGSNIAGSAPPAILEIHQLAATEPEQPVITLLPLTHVWNEAYAVPENMVVQSCPIKLSAFYETVTRLVQSSGSVSAATPVAITTQPQTPLRMLIVDDNETNCMLMEHMLGTLGYRADVVTSGEAALRALRRNAYEVVWLDVHLTGNGLDGLEVVQQFNESQRGVSPYIVAVTASASLQDRERCLAAGMHDYLCKPIDWNLLEEVIGRAYVSLREQASMSADLTSDVPHMQSLSNEQTCQDALSASAVKTLSGYTLPELIVTTFFEEASEMLLDIRRSVAVGDTEKLSATLHRLKSSSWYIAGAQMTQACQLFEDLVQLGDRAHWKEAMYELEEALAQACQAINHTQIAGTTYMTGKTSLAEAQSFSLVSSD